MAFQDQTITCPDCGQEFIFTAGEQEFFQMKGLQNPPKRCKICRAERRQNFTNTTDYKSKNLGPQIFETVCSQCGGIAEVPFRPKGDRPVYCDTCYAGHRESITRGARASHP